MTLGLIRYPKVYFKNIWKNNKKNFLLSQLVENYGTYSYPEKLKNKLLEFNKNELLQYITEKKLFIYETCS